MFDAIIIGAGFAGAVLARQLAAEKNLKVLIVEKRKHIAGNCHDYINDHGVLVHSYGPHLFHTSDKEVFNYLANFTEWQEYQHHVLAYVDGQKIPIPFNLNSLKMLFPESLTQSLENKLVEHFGYDVKVPILELRQTDDIELKRLADYIYEKIFVNYTSKQWGCKPEDISPEVTGRVPINISYDGRYFQDVYQAVPKNGYTKLFENLLDHPNIHLLLNTDYKTVMNFNFEDRTISAFGDVYTGEVVFTGMIDALCDYCFGELPYRSIDFEFETYEKHFYQEGAVINYPNNYDYTRITEFKHIHFRDSKYTTILREFPRSFLGMKDEYDTPSYPVFKDENIKIIEKYKEHTEDISQLTLIGRLAEYKYYDMDDIVKRALEVFNDKFSR